jgi:hypothetical protein
VPLLHRESTVIGCDLALVERMDGQVDLYRTTKDDDALLGTFSSISEIWQAVDEIDTAWASAA